MEEDRADGGSFFYVHHDAAHILFVDDDPIMREFAQVHLSTDKAQVRLAADGVEALESLASQVPDVMLLDLEMPRLDGFEVLARLRAEPATRDLPVIVVTGREDVTAIDRAFEAGATSFLVKPINWRLLSYQIRYVMRAGRAERADVITTIDVASLRVGLLRLAQAGAELVRQALGGSPELRPAAQIYATLLADTVKLTKPSRRQA